MVMAAEEVLYEDDFSTLDPGWGDPSNRIKAEDGKLVVTPAPGMSQTALNQGLLFEDMTATIKARIANGDDPAQVAGLAFWGSDLDNYYFAAVSANGRFGVVRRIKGKWLFPVSYRTSPLVKQGMGEWNEVRVVTKGNNATLFINGEQAISFKGQAPAGGSLLGVHGESGVESQTVCEFTELKVTK